jgi:hypothetical protein
MPAIYLVPSLNALAHGFPVGGGVCMRYFFVLKLFWPVFHFIVLKTGYGEQPSYRCSLV